MTDTALRLLRDGRRDDQPAPVVSMRGSAGVLGGEALFHHLLSTLTNAVRAGRAQARSVCLLALHRPPQHYSAALGTCTATTTGDSTPDPGGGSSGAGPVSVVRVVDGFSDPQGWMGLLGEHSSGGGQGHALGTQGGTQVGLGDGLVPLWNALDAAVRQHGPCLVAMDSVEPLMRSQNKNPQSVFSLLEALRWHSGVSGLLVGIPCEEAITPQCLTLLDHLAQAVLYLHPPGAAQGQGEVPPGTGGTVEMRQKRQTGRVLRLVEEFEIEASPGERPHQGSTCLPSTPDTSFRMRIHAARLGTVRTPEDHSAVSATEGARGGEGSAVQGHSVGMGANRLTPSDGAGAKPPGAPSAPGIEALSFRLDLSEEERRAREGVVLPFEFKDKSQAVHIYDGRQATGVAGSGSGSGGGHGSIIYERDSDEDEAPDSDEDPDDDLDI